MGDEGGEELDPYVKYIEDFYEDVARKDYSGLGGHTQRGSAKPWSDEDSLRFILDPEYSETDGLQRRVQIYPESNPEQPLNIDIETLRILYKAIELGDLSGFFLLPENGNVQPQELDLFGRELNVSDCKGQTTHTYTIHGWSATNNGGLKATYTATGEEAKFAQARSDIIEKLDEYKKTLKEQGITIEDPTGRVYIDDIVLERSVVENLLNTLKEQGLCEDIGYSDVSGQNTKSVESIRKSINELVPKEYGITGLVIGPDIGTIGFEVAQGQNGSGKYPITIIPCIELH